jgi:hypothetical protein
MKYQFMDRKGGNTLLPEGDYKLRFVGGEFMVSRAGNEMLKITMEDVDSGAQITDFLFFTEKSAWKTDAFLKCFGVAPKRGEEFDLDEAFLSKITGKEGEALIGVEEYNGVKRNRIGEFLSKTMAKVEKDPEPAKPKAKAQPKAEPKPDNDEIPF